MLVNMVHWCEPVHDAPPWHKCICFCNPCWCEDDDRYIDYVAAGSQGEADDDTSHLDRDDIKEMAASHMLSHSSPRSTTTTTLNDGTTVATSMTSMVELSPREEDTFVLPDDYDANREYENQFGEFDAVTGDRRPDNNGSVTVRVHNGGGGGGGAGDDDNKKTTLSQVRARLDVNDYGKPSALTSDFNLLLIMARQAPLGGTERGEMIECYERYHHQYRDHPVLQEDRHMADFALSGARNETQWSSKALRLENYRKAIFFTHNEVSKLQLKKEYREYCLSIMLTRH